MVADPEQNNNIPVPRACPGPKATPGGGAVCGATGLEEVLGSRECVDYQEIRIQDKVCSGYTISMFHYIICV